MNRLLDIMQRLRDPETGCPWDCKQTFDTIFPYTLEEVYEVGDAIDRGAMDELKNELGDLLFQVVFYAQMAEEQGAFNFQDVVDGISDKMVRRHPHVFANRTYKDEAEQKADWERIKRHEQQEKRASQPDNTCRNTPAKDYFADITKGLTALQRGQKVLNRAGESGFDWPNWRPIVDKVYEEVDEIIDAVESGESRQRVEEEVGDLFIVVTNLARHLQVDAENAARKAQEKFSRRYNQMMDQVRQSYPQAEGFTLEQMEAGWEQVKKSEKVIEHMQPETDHVATRRNS